MKTIKFSPDIYRKLQKLRTKDTILFKKVHKQLKIFQQDPLHPSLRLHKITREVENVWSISIDKSIKMLYTESAEDVYFFEIGHHEVYRN
jgi:Txe/YoeB family toxin of Txe-Axe toxin-antitoxin module